MKTDILRHIFVYVIMLIITISCNDDKTIITIEDNKNNIDSLVNCNIFRNFKFNINAYNYRISDTTDYGYESLNRGNKVHIFIYKQGESPLSAPHFYKGLYKINIENKLMPVYDNIQIPKGIYDFYFLSVLNSQYDQVPVFDISGGISDYIYNQRDYAWAKLENVDVTDSVEKVLDVSLERSCVKINISFNSASPYNIDSIYNIKITAPDHTQCYWNLYSGLINPSDSISETIDLKNTKNICETYILPSYGNDSISLKFNAIVDKINRHYNLKLPRPEKNIYHFGYLYNYNVMVYGENIECSLKN